MRKSDGLYKTDMLERSIYAAICRHDGIKAKDIGKLTAADKKTINQYLYKAPFMRELCYRDGAYQWHGFIRQDRPHVGLGDFCAYYGSVGEFLELSEEEWFDSMLEGCRRIGRNLNDTRGLFHSFKDCRQVMAALFADLDDAMDPKWEICQAAKYTEYLEVLFGPSYDVIPALVLTRAHDLYRYERLDDRGGEIPVCSGDMLFNLFDEYIGFLEK